MRRWFKKTVHIHQWKLENKEGSLTFNISSYHNEWKAEGVYKFLTCKGCGKEELYFVEKDHFRAKGTVHRLPERYAGRKGLLINM